MRLLDRRRALDVRGDLRGTLVKQEESGDSDAS